MSDVIEAHAIRIAGEASRIGAGRVVLRTEHDFFYCTAEVAAIVEALRHPGLYKYKLQQWQKNKWTDIQKYRRIKSSTKEVDAPKKIVENIGAGNFDELASLPKSNIIRAIKLEPRKYMYALRNIHRSVHQELVNRKESPTLVAAVGFLTEVNRGISVPLSTFLGTTLTLQSNIRPDDLTKIHERATQEALLSKITGEAERYLDGLLASRIAAAGVLGKVASLTDRPTAASYFRTLLYNDTDNLLDNFYLEEGVHTYFEPSEFTDETSQVAGKIRDSIHSVEVATTNNTFGVVIAMDPSFFRIYGPQVFSYAQQLPEVDFNLFLCGAAGDIDNLVQDGKRFQNSLERLNRTGSSSNVSYYHVPVPPFVQNRKTFYASARFFAPQLLLERYENLYLMDADLSTDVDPRPYFERVSHLSFATPKMPGISALYPWRRYMAGNIALNRAVLESSLIDDIQEYLVYGLQFKKNWTLDQNALAYVVERYPELYSELNSFDRPFYQSQFRLAWEKRYVSVNGGH